MSAKLSYILGELMPARMTSTNLLLVSHGYRVTGTKDKLMRSADKLARGFASTAAPGALLVEALPFRELPNCS